MISLKDLKVHCSNTFFIVVPGEDPDYDVSFRSLIEWFVLLDVVFVCSPGNKGVS